MNLKKFISGVSALAVAASAFAGLAVTAGAAGLTYNIVYGTPTYDGETITAVNDQTDFAGDTNEQTGITWADANNNTSRFVIDGSVLGVGANASWTKDFNEPVSTGKVYFNETYSVSANGNNHVQLVASDGTVIFAGADNNTGNNATQTVATVCGKDITNYVRQPRKAGYRAEVVVDLDAKSVSYTLYVSSGNGSYSTLTGSETLTASDVKGIVAGKTTYGYYLDSVSLYQAYDPSAQKYEYNVNYTLGETVVKNSSGKVEAGTEITAESVFTENGTKYFITAEEAPTLTVSAEGENTLNVPVRVANNYNVAINAVGDVEESLVADTVVEGDNYTYGIPQYVVKDGIAYEGATLSSDSYYKETVNNVAADIAKDITYTKKYDNVVVYDDLNGSDDKNAGVRASMGSSYNNAGYTSAALEAGTYVAVVRFAPIGRGSTLTVGDTVLIDGADVKDDNNPDGKFAKNAWVTTATSEFTVEAGATIKWNKGSSSGTTDPIDTVIIYSVSAAPTEVDGVVDVVNTFAGDDYDGEATALTATFDITGATVNTVTVTPDGEQVAGEAKSQAIPATSETTLVYGIVVNKIVDKNAFTAKATFVE